MLRPDVNKELKKARFTKGCLFEKTQVLLEPLPPFRWESKKALKEATEAVLPYYAGNCIAVPDESMSFVFVRQ